MQAFLYRESKYLSFSERSPGPARATANSRPATSSQQPAAVYSRGPPARHTSIIRVQPLLHGMVGGGSGSRGGVVAWKPPCSRRNGMAKHGGASAACVLLFGACLMSSGQGFVVQQMPPSFGVQGAIRTRSLVASVRPIRHCGATVLGLGMECAASLKAEEEGERLSIGQRAVGTPYSSIHRILARSQGACSRGDRVVLLL